MSRPTELRVRPEFRLRSPHAKLAVASAEQPHKDFVGKGEESLTFTTLREGGFVNAKVLEVGASFMGVAERSGHRLPKRWTRKLQGRSGRELSGHHLVPVFLKTVMHLGISNSYWNRRSLWR